MRDPHVQHGDVAAGRSQPLEESLPQRRRPLGDRVELRTFAARRREHVHHDLVEGKNAAAAARGLHLALGAVEHRLHDLQRLPRRAADEVLDRQVERARDARFQLPCFAQEVHTILSLRAVFFRLKAEATNLFVLIDRVASAFRRKIQSTYFTNPRADAAAMISPAAGTAAPAP
jgi:hypothetical protein